jgi:tetrahydromethanopterin S-methyltransferase subunit D
VVAAPIAAVFQGMLGATGGAVLYFELRRIKEGVGVEALASIFD